MSQNVFTKFDSDRYIYDLCLNNNVCESVKTMYEKYKGRCEYYLNLDHADIKIRRYYVYAWHTNTDTKMFFYIGKGTKTRYNHIISEIKKYKEGKHNLRFQRYSEIQEKWGIDYDIIISNLTEYEALIYEQCLKLEMIDNGEILLNVEGIPDEYLPQSWYINKNGTSPTLLKDPVFQRYFEDYGLPKFDEVNYINLMKTYIYPYFVDTTDLGVISDKNAILEWLSNNSAKVYKAISTKTASVIVQGNLNYDRFTDYKRNNIKVFSSKDVLDYIIKNPPARGG